MSPEHKSQITPCDLIGYKNSKGESQTHPGPYEHQLFLTTRDRRGPNIGTILRPGQYSVIALRTDARMLMIGGFALNHDHALRKAKRRERKNILRS